MTAGATGAEPRSEADEEAANKSADIFRQAGLTDIANQLRASAKGEMPLEVQGVTTPEEAAPSGTEELARARAFYRDLQFEESLAAVGEREAAVERLTQAYRTASKLGARPLAEDSDVPHPRRLLGADAQLQM